jgi:hypothetical protein
MLLLTVLRELGQLLASRILKLWRIFECKQKHLEAPSRALSLEK